MCDIENHIRLVQHKPTMFTETEVAMVQEVVGLRQQLSDIKKVGRVIIEAHKASSVDWPAMKEFEKMVGR